MREGRESRDLFSSDAYRPIIATFLGAAAVERLAPYLAPRCESRLETASGRVGPSLWAEPAPWLWFQPQLAQLQPVLVSPAAGPARRGGAGAAASIGTHQVLRRPRAAYIEDWAVT